MAFKGLGHVCGFPGRPVDGGFYLDLKVARPGDTVEYFCWPGFSLFGKKERVCLTEGFWSDHMPVCMENLAEGQHTTSSIVKQGQVSSLAVDGDRTTCTILDRATTQRYWQVDLPPGVRIGHVAITISPLDEDDEKRRRREVWPGEHFVAESTQDGKRKKRHFYTQHFQFPKKPFQQLTIYIAMVTEALMALYSKCLEFKGLFYKSRMVLPCDGKDGLSGKFLYIQDNSNEYTQTVLCEVEVFAYRGAEKCGEPEIPVYGNVTVDGGTATYTCDQGYKLQGVRIRVCSVGGLWSDYQPVCVEITCGYPDQYPHAEGELTNGSSTINATAEYKCDYGYMMSKESIKTMVVCQQDGTWDKAYFTCDRDYTIDLRFYLGDKRKTGYSFIGREDPFSFPLVTAALCVGVLVMLAVVVACIITWYRAKRVREMSATDDDDDNSFATNEEDYINSEEYPTPSNVPTISVSDRAFNELPPILEDEESFEMQALEIPYSWEHRELDTKISIPEVQTNAKKTITWGETKYQTVSKSPTNEYCYKALGMRAEDSVMLDMETLPEPQADIETDDNNDSDGSNTEVKVRWSLPSSLKTIFKFKKIFFGNEMRNKDHPENKAEMCAQVDNFLDENQQADENLQYQECSGGIANPSADQVVALSHYVLVDGNPDLYPGLPTGPAKIPKGRSTFSALKQLFSPYTDRM
ncbi:uncharacterized protein LOC126299396 [Schistocerca gregaria]|uniref:uncharacterized protein LOC126299396 n=1 Tax=Schistocerca gregaria TaxID=7010 RepID=UPI00211E8128|nr:uncharacterized protein LOC126299396 [Schistocerca gregaria]